MFWIILIISLILLCFSIFYHLKFKNNLKKYFKTIGYIKTYKNIQHYSKKNPNATKTTFYPAIEYFFENEKFAKELNFKNKFIRAANAFPIWVNKKHPEKIIISKTDYTGIIIFIISILLFLINILINSNYS